MTPSAAVRALTALFVFLILVPAGVLAWLGFRFSESLEEQARIAVEKEARDYEGAQRARFEALERRVLEREESARAQVQAAAQDVLPFRGPGCFFDKVRRLLDAGGVVRIVDGLGRIRWPRPPGPLEIEALPEWSRFEAARLRAEQLAYAGGRRAEAGMALWREAMGLQALSIRALALAQAADLLRRGGEDPEPVRAALAHIPHSEVRRAGPFAVEIHGGIDGTTCADVPAPPAVHARWLAMPDYVRWQQEPELFRTVRIPLRDGFVVEWGALYRPEFDFGDEGRFRTVVGAAVAGSAGDGGVAGSVSFLGRDLPYRITHTGAAEIAAGARRRRSGTVAAIAALMVLMVVGLWVVRRALARERAARRMRDAFIANVSHDLKTPLTSVRMYAEMLAHDDLSERERRSYGDVVEAEGARLSSLVEDMLDFGALERGTRTLEPEPVDLGATVAALGDAWRPLAHREGVTLEAGGEAEALADPTALGRILTNLLQNAWRHGRPARDGGTPRVRLVAGPGPVVEVRDNGPGVALGPRAFERFVGTGGTGIGLALARDLARGMGGDLTWQDDGAETVFRLELTCAS